MNGKILETLAWRTITKQLAAETVTAAGRERALKLAPLDSVEQTERALDEVAEAETIANHEQSLPLGTLGDFAGIFKRLRVSATLNGKELWALSQLLTVTNDVVTFFAKWDETEAPLAHLQRYVDQLAPLPDICERLEQSVAPDGSLYDTASPALQRIRRQIKDQTDAVKAEMNRLLQTQADKLSDTILTVRDERYVLPVKAAYRQAFGGVVHDESATGQTLYIEPAATQALNRRIQALESDEKAEVARILYELSTLVAPELEALVVNHAMIGQLDFIQAKHQLARAMHATKPTIAEDRRAVHLKQAVHPFLDPKTAVRNDIYFPDECTMLIITGPNTGGKTITLKTLGLLQLMGQSGLYITAAEGSRIGFFDEIFADIGDEQSIEANLSTFSGHMTNIIRILNGTTAHDLVLLDELGAGTDPKEGAALGIAILNRLAQAHAMVATTTHYPELKAYAYNEPHSINASVEFDDATLSPTYRLLIGQPGRSNALDISRRLGLDEAIVSEAAATLDRSSRDLSDMIKDLDQARRDYLAEQETLEKEVAESESLLGELRKVYHDLTERKDGYRRKAQQEANAIVAKKRHQADEILNEIREWQKNHPEGQAIKEHEMIERQHALDQLTEEEERLKDNKVLRRAKRERREREAGHTLQKGDQVKVPLYDSVGTLVEKRGAHQWLVQLGTLKMEVAESALEYEPKKNEKAERASVHAKQAKRVKPELDLRGLRVDEALHQLDAYLDQALLAGYPNVTIIHGFGTGAVRKAVQDALTKHKRVESFHYAGAHHGGNGATVAELKR